MADDLKVEQLEKQQNEHAAQNNSADLLAGTDVVAAFIWHGMGNSYPQQAVRSGKKQQLQQQSRGLIQWQEYVYLCQAPDKKLP